jgi:hypothetical protein
VAEATVRGRLGGAAERRSDPEGLVVGVAVLLAHGVGRVGPGVAVLRAEFGAGPGEGGGEAAAVVGQHVGEAEGEGGRGFAQESDGAPLGCVVLDGQVRGARAPVDGDKEVALAALAVRGLELRQVLDVDVHEAEVVVAEGALAPLRPVRGGRRPAAQPLGAQDAPDAVAVEAGQEVGDHEGQVVEGEVGGAAQRADHGALLLGGLPGQPVRPGRVVQAVLRAALAPLADGLGADAEAPGQDAGGFVGAGDLGADGRRGAGIGVDLQHGSSSSRR